MNRKLVGASAIVILAGAALAAAQAQARERQIVAEAGHVLLETMAIPDQGIPRALLAEAQGLVIVPSMIRGGFVVGAKHGRGVALARDESGVWSNPSFIRITGGNFGFQAGLQATDLILVFRNRTRAADMMRGRFAIGGNAAAAAGPVGRSLSAATDLQLRAEILSYSRSRGIFAGVSIDGAVIRPDARATAAFYSQTPAFPQGIVPAEAVQLLSILDSVSTTCSEAPVHVAHHDQVVVCRQLIAAHQRLLEILDPAWQQHLALPADMATATTQGRESVREAQARFNRLVGDPQFQALTERQEFLETLTLLNRHATLQEAAANNVVSLPAPPR